MLVFLASVMVGCGSPSMSSSQTATSQTGAVNQKQYEAGRHYWRNRLASANETQVIGPIPIGDRRVTLKARALTVYAPGSGTSARMPSVDYDHSKIESTDGGFYELIDSDSGKVILPLDYWEIMPVTSLASVSTMPLAYELLATS